MASWISANDVAAYLCIDDMIRAQIIADTVTGMLRDYLARDLEQQAYAELHHSNFTDYVLLNNSPVASISRVEIDGIGEITPAARGKHGWRLDHQVPRKLIFSGYGRLPRSNVPNIEIHYIAGYPIDAPPDSNSSPWSVGTGFPTAIHEAMRLTASAIHNAQAADPNLQSESTAGVFSGTFYPTGVGAIPPGARSNLEPYISVTP